MSLIKGMDKDPYDDTTPLDNLAFEIAQEWGLEHYAAHNWNESHLDAKKQLKLVKYYFYREGNIDKIKKFHEMNGISYHEPYQLSMWGEHMELGMGKYPLDWALRKKCVDFALWLIKEQNVDVKSLSSEKYSKFHYLALGLANKTCPPNYAELMKRLMENKASINTLDCYSRTPLRAYTDGTNYREGYNREILKLFFDHGASLVVKKKDERGHVVTCNSVLRELKYSQKMNITHPVKVIARLFKSRLDTESPWMGVDYRNQLSYAKKKYDAYFIALSLSNKKLKFFKMPKPVIHMICKLAATYDENIQDIKASLADNIEIRTTHIQGVKINNHRKIFVEKETFHALSPLQYAQKTDSLNTNASLLKILDPNFWDNPLAECYNALNKLEDADNF